MEKKEKFIYLPKEVEAKRNWIQGYGMKEAIQSSILFSIMAPLVALLLWILNITELMALSLLVVGMLSVSMCVKNQGMSIVDFSLRVIRYKKEQKFYRYKKY